jgi:hypothetical protein
MPSSWLPWFAFSWAGACLLLSILLRRKILAIYPDFFDEADEQRWLGLRRKTFERSMIFDTDLPGDWAEFGPFVKYGLYTVRAMIAMFLPLIMALGYFSR